MVVMVAGFPVGGIPYYLYCNALTPVRRPPIIRQSAIPRSTGGENRGQEPAVFAGIADTELTL
jgi:hypothetical protein